MEDIMTADGVKPDVEVSTGERSQNRAGLAGASWIWHSADESNPPPCQRLFRATIDISEGRKVVMARVSMTADNSFVLSLNGAEICRGDSFHQVVDADIAKALLRSGRNEVLVRATNGGDAPNPAGLIGKRVITLGNGGLIERTTDAASWESSAGENRWAAAGMVGPLGCGPWGQIGDRAVPNVTWIHRRSRDADIYFLTNPLNQPLDVTAAFRAKAKTVQRFEPLDGSVHGLPEESVAADGRTTVPLHFEPEEAFFVVFRDGPAMKTTHRDHPELQQELKVEGPWQVAFDTQWVKPLPLSAAAGAKEWSVVFDRLEDWSKRPEDGLKGYSGMAVYRTSFDLPAKVLPEQLVFVDAGVVKEMARVELNGRDLGVAWCPPWRVTIPGGLLKERGNRLVISVANTWNNRLCADHALPEKERLTRVGHNLHQEAARHGPQPSGLLGPVRLVSED